MIPRCCPRRVLFSLLCVACGDASPRPAPEIGLWFGAACRAGDRVAVAAVGDVILHEPLQRQAYAAGHATLWAEVAPRGARAGVAYANLEGPTAAGIDFAWQPAPDPGPVYDGVVYTGFPRFNYHASVIPALAAAGFDVLSTANNHALDRGPLGVELTIAALEAAGMPHAGTRRRGAAATPYALTDRGGFRLAWIACSFSTNAPDEERLTLMCDDDGDEVERAVRDLAARADVDAVIVTPHGGDEYSFEPAPRQRRLAERVLEAGALAVLGNHPHVVQPWEKRVTRDGRETFVAYSIGNFVSGQVGLERRASAIVLLVLVRSAGETAIAGVRYVPIVMHDDPYAAWPTDTSSHPDAAAAAELVEGILGPDNEIASTATTIDLGCR